MVKPALTALFALSLVGVANPQSTRSTTDGADTAAAVAAERHAPPVRPQASVELPADAPAARTTLVKAGESLQAAIDAASPGDRLLLEPRAVYQGPFRLSAKQGDGWITIASAAEAKLPARGQRVTRAHQAHMPHLVAESGSVFEAAPGAHHYRFVGLEISPADGVYLNTLVQLGADETTVDAQPHHIVIERSYLHGDAKKGARRGVALNSRHSAVVDSRLADFKEVGADSQAISGWNGAGPFLIQNNYLEAAGENVMFGGADPATPDLVPSDITVARNHMAKPLRWKKGDAGYEGTDWAVKNLFELKNARRVLVEGNVLEYNWPHAQNGFAILFTVRNQDGRAPWSVVEDVTFVNNIVRHVGAGINVLGRDDNQPSRQTSRIAIRNNLFMDVGGDWGNGRLFQLLDGTHGISIDHNTALQTGSILFGGDHAPHTGFVFQNNIAPHNEHGISGSGTSPGTQTLARYFPRAVVRGNVIIGGSESQYPAGNSFARSDEDAGVAALRTEDLATVAARPPRAAAGGRIAGADLVTLMQAVDGVAPAERRDESASVPPVAGSLAAGSLVAAALEDGGPAIAVFWTALSLLVYIYVGYPLVAAVRARIRQRPHVRAAIAPSVSIVVVAYNEEDRIEDRITNLLALDYPAGQLDILIGSDGSTDNTAELARQYEPRVRVEAFSSRRGKPAMLNDLVARVSGEIVLFADARQPFAPDTLRTIVRNFADPSVGAVSGELIVRPAAAATAGQGAALYWRYEKLIRAAESRADSTVGATGAIYAIRRALFEPIPEDTLLDDVLIPLRIVRKGYRVLFEPEAHAYDEASASARQEFGRKARTIAGNFQLFSRERWLFDPRQNRLWFATLSHKVLRLSLPLLHVALLLSNLAAASLTPYAWLLAGQILFYAFALCGCLQQQGRRRFIGFSVAYTLCLMCWSTIVGYYRFMTDRQPITWERTPVAAAVRNRA